MTQVQSYAEAERRAEKLRKRGVPLSIIRQRKATWYKTAARVQGNRRKLSQSVPLDEGLRETLDECLELVAEHTGVLSKHIVATRRLKHYVPARRIFVNVAVGLRSRPSLPQLAVYMRRPGGHTSVIFWRDSIKDDERKLAKKLIRAMRQRMARKALERGAGQRPPRERPSVAT